MVPIGALVVSFIALVTPCALLQIILLVLDLLGNSISIRRWYC